MKHIVLYVILAEENKIVLETSQIQVLKRRSWYQSTERDSVIK